ncbi:MAG: 23S rRNA pseudouridine(1911/1915/1917) synthase RluD [Gallionellaceae bacterium]|jgi:23S rRNA pseudouridine1911/1915/1917 synthase|nr:23S rRNA pseudouridine(1911/1915/1917) synthase RluD [Gallionellaceae bacterium]
MTESEKILGDYTPLVLKVPDDCAGLRLDQALAKLLPDYSRSRLQEWITQGLAQLDGAAATVKQKVHGGETIVVAPQAHPAEQPYRAEAIALHIVFEDDSILVIDKPAGLVVHPGSGNWDGTLLNALLHHAPQLAGIPRAGIVHRLDKDTSGLLVVAKTLTAQTALVRQLQARTVKREYYALVYGEVARDGMIDAPLGRHPAQRTKMAIVPSGKPAVTHYQVAERFPAIATGTGQGCTLLRCRLETGRTHQIRVHLASIRHPLVGDHTYLKGAQKCPPSLRELLTAFPRQALHAAQLGLEHPASGAWMEWQAPLPPDFAGLLQQMRATMEADA